MSLTFFPKDQSNAEQHADGIIVSLMWSLSLCSRSAWSPVMSGETWISVHFQHRLLSSPAHCFLFNSCDFSRAPKVDHLSTIMWRENGSLKIVLSLGSVTESLCMCQLEGHSASQASLTNCFSYSTFFLRLKQTEGVQYWNIPSSIKNIFMSICSSCLLFRFYMYLSVVLCYIMYSW